MKAGVVLHFDRLTDGTLVAVHQGVAAIVHPPTILRPPSASFPRLVLRRWCLAGDGISADSRPCGLDESGSIACAQAAEALGVHLGVTVDGYEVGA